MDIPTLQLLAKQAAAMYPFAPPMFPPSVYYRFLYLLAQKKRPELSVELGLCGGGGSFHLAKGWPKGIVVGVDVRVEYPDNLAYIQKECPNFRFHQGDSVQSAPILCTGLGVDILFVDTTHTYEQTMAELGAYVPYLKRDAVICLDDLHREGMPLAWAEMPEPKVRLDTLHIGGSPTDGGFGVVIWRG